MAIFAAFAFTIMMFNIPVPGGTTAHAVGGTLIAVVLAVGGGPGHKHGADFTGALFWRWALAIFINCMNMAVVLPFVGYYTYRLIAGRVAPAFGAAGLGGRNRGLWGESPPPGCWWG